MRKRSRKKLNRLISEVDVFKTVKILNKKKTEFLFKDRSIKIINF